MKKNRRRIGSILVLTLITLTVMTLYVLSLIALNRQNLTYSKFNSRSLAAQQMAQAGVNHMLNKLMYDASFGVDTANDKIEYFSADKDAKYLIYFDSTNPDPEMKFYSVNNLGGYGDHPTPNFEGKAVKPSTVDLVVTGISGLNSGNRSIHRIHTILRRDFDCDLSLGADGQIDIDGEAKINGIVSMLTKDVETGGGIHSNYDDTPQATPVPSPSVTMTATPTPTPTPTHTPSPSPAPYTGSCTASAITIKDQNTFTLGNGASISAVGTVCPCLQHYDPKENDAPKKLPEFSILDIVNRKNYRPLPPGLLYSAVTETYSGLYVNVTNEQYVDGNLVINGDLNLCNACLFVKGNLQVNGGVKGYGGIFVGGQMEVRGGNVNLITNQKNAAAIFADNGISITGLSSQSYLESLASSYPSIDAKYQVFKRRYTVLQEFLKSKEMTGNWQFTPFFNEFGKPNKWLRKYCLDGVEDFIPDPVPETMDKDEVAAICIWWSTYQMAKMDEESPALLMDYTIPIADSDGVNATSAKEATIPALILEIRNTLGGAADTDPSASDCLRD